MPCTVQLYAGTPVMNRLISLVMPPPVGCGGESYWMMRYQPFRWVFSWDTWSAGVLVIFVIVFFVSQCNLNPCNRRLGCCKSRLHWDAKYQQKKGK
jgi:hypothetical protein